MNYRLYTIIFLVFMTLNSVGQINYSWVNSYLRAGTHLEFWSQPLIGKIKTVKESKFEINKDSTALIRTECNFFKYQKNGNITESKEYSIIDSLISIKKYKYYNTGLLKYWRAYDSKGRKLNRINYTFTKNGRMRSVKCYNPKFGLVWNAIYKYDDFGNLIEWKENGKSKGISHLEKYEYDLSGKLVFHFSYTINGKLRYTEQFLRVDDKMEHSITWINENPKIKANYSYDSLKNLVEIRYDNDFESFSYDDSNKIIGKTNVRNEKIYYKTEIIYNSKGQVLEVITSYPQSNSKKYIQKYKWDDPGNLINCKHIYLENENEKVYEENERIIEYY